MVFKSQTNKWTLVDDGPLIVVIVLCITYIWHAEQLQGKESVNFVIKSLFLYI